MRIWLRRGRSYTKVPLLLARVTTGPGLCGPDDNMLVRQKGNAVVRTLQWGLAQIWVSRLIWDGCTGV